MAEAEASAERTRANAAAAVEQEGRRARAQLRAESAELALERARSLIEARVTDADRDRLVDEFLEHLENGATGRPQN